MSKYKAHCQRRRLPLLTAVLGLAFVLAGCSGPIGPIGSVDGPEILSFQAVPSGSGTYRLSWEVRGLEDSRLTLAPGPNGQERVDVAGSTAGGVGGIDVQPASDTTYVLVLENGTARAERRLTVRVAGSSEGPTVEAFDADELGEGRFRLHWRIDGLDGGTVTLEPGPNGQTGADVTDRTDDGEGQIEVRPAANTHYTLTATNGSGTSQRGLTVEVGETGPGPQILWLSVDPAAANDGVEVEATLSWEVDNADWLRLYGPGLDDAGLNVTGSSSHDVRTAPGESFVLRAGDDEDETERSVSLAARSEPAAAFLIAGQSNAQGVNLDPEAARDFISADTGLRMLGNDYVWKEAYEPLDDCRGQVDDVSRDPTSGSCASGVSMGVSLGNHVIAATGGEAYLIPAAKGGSGLTEWLPPNDPYDRDSLFGSANHRATLAGRERGAPLGYVSGGRRYGAIVWYQGETDTTSLEKTGAYVGRTDEVLDAFQADLDAPVILVQLSRRRDDDDPRRNDLYQRVREHQRAMASGARTADGSASSDADSGRYLVVTHDLPLANEGNGDDKHLTAEAQVELGRRVALAFRQHLQGESVDGTGPRLEGIEVSADGTTIRVRTDRPITRPQQEDAGAYSGYFRIYEEGEGVDPARIRDVMRDPEDDHAVRIRVEPQSALQGRVEVAYIPPEGPHASVATDVIRSKDCDEPMPGYDNVCLPLPAFGLTPQEPLQGLRLMSAEDE